MTPRVDWPEALFWFVAIPIAMLLVWGSIAWLALAAHPPEPITAHGGRTPCATVSACRRVVVWQRHERLHLEKQLARKWRPTAQYACNLGETVYHVAASHCMRVVGCESGGDRFQVTPPYGASGLAQFLVSTWRGTAFGRAGFSVFDPIAPVLQMDAIAAGQGFNTGYGWAASYGCHHLSGPER